jgi:hypothetical protein
MPDKPSIALELVEIRRNVWCVYKNGKVVIITSNKRIAEHYYGANNSQRDRSTKDTS